MNAPGTLCLFGCQGMFSRSGVHCVQSIDLFPVDQILAPCHPPGSDLLDVHDLPARRRSTAAQHPNLPLTVVALERPDFEAKSEALPFVGLTLTLQAVIRARNPSAVVILRAGGSNGNETTEAKGRVKILRCEGDVTPQSRAECTVSLKNQMSVKLTGWRKMGKVSPAGRYAATMLQDRGNRRADDDSGSRAKRVNSDAATGIRKSSVEYIKRVDPPPKIVTGSYGTVATQRPGTVR